MDRSAIFRCAEHASNHVAVIPENGVRYGCLVEKLQRSVCRIVAVVSVIVANFISSERCVMHSAWRSFWNASSPKQFRTLVENLANKQHSPQNHWSMKCQRFDCISFIAFASFPRAPHAPHSLAKLPTKGDIALYESQILRDVEFVNTNSSQRYFKCKLSVDAVVSHSREMLLTKTVMQTTDIAACRWSWCRWAIHS